MTEHPKPCHFVGHDQPRMLRAHVKDCATSGCEGCQPCEVAHCGVCSVRHTESLTCPTCVGVVRTDLALIATLTEHMLTEATHRGVNSEAAMLAGPAADVEAWRNRWMSARNGRIPADWLEDCRDELHPLYVLGTWDMLVTEHYDHSTRTQRVTVESAVQYLGANLTDLAQDDAFAFEELAREVRACRGHLEDVLHDGERDEKGAPCYMCGAARLVKDYGDDDDGDKWTCPRCGQMWNESEYRENVRQGYVALSDVLNATDIAGRTRVPEGTVRRWASSTTRWVPCGDGTNTKVILPPRLRPSGRADGRWLYRVEDVLALRDRLAVPA